MERITVPRGKGTCSTARCAARRKARGLAEMGPVPFVLTRADDRDPEQRGSRENQSVDRLAVRDHDERREQAGRARTRRCRHDLERPIAQSHACRRTPSQGDARRLGMKDGCANANQSPQPAIRSASVARMQNGDAANADQAHTHPRMPANTASACDPV